MTPSIDGLLWSDTYESREATRTGKREENFQIVKIGGDSVEVTLGLSIEKEERMKVSLGGKEEGRMHVRAPIESRKIIRKEKVHEGRPSPVTLPLRSEKIREERAWRQ